MFYHIEKYLPTPGGYRNPSRFHNGVESSGGVESCRFARKLAKEKGKLPPLPIFAKKSNN